MSEQLIERLSLVESPGEQSACAVVMVGSFAPIHRGHFDATAAATDALIARGKEVGSIVLVPNSAAYVRRKLPNFHETWTYQRRIEEILTHAPHPIIPTFVDDVSAEKVELEQINDHVPATLEHFLGITASNVYLVTGSDQLASMESHLAIEQNNAICVLRPGSFDTIYDQVRRGWAADAIESGRLIITDREDMINDISSTAVRASVDLDRLIG